MSRALPFEQLVIAAFADDKACCPCERAGNVRVYPWSKCSRQKVRKRLHNSSPALIQNSPAFPFDTGTCFVEIDFGRRRASCSQSNSACLWGSTLGEL